MKCKILIRLKYRGEGFLFQSDVVQLLMKAADTDLHFIRQCSSVRSLRLAYLNFSIHFPSLFLCLLRLPRIVRQFVVSLSLSLCGVFRRCFSRHHCSIWRQDAESGSMTIPKQRRNFSEVINFRDGLFARHIYWRVPVSFSQRILDFLKYLFSTGLLSPSMLLVQDWGILYVRDVCGCDSLPFLPSWFPLCHVDNRTCCYLPLRWWNETCLMNWTG